MECSYRLFSAWRHLSRYQRRFRSTTISSTGTPTGWLLPVRSCSFSVGALATLGAKWLRRPPASPPQTYCSIFFAFRRRDWQLRRPVFRLLATRRFTARSRSSASAPLFTQKPNSDFGKRSNLTRRAQTRPPGQSRKIASTGPSISSSPSTSWYSSFSLTIIWLLSCHYFSIILSLLRDFSLQSLWS